MITWRYNNMYGCNNMYRYNNPREMTYADRRKFINHIFSTGDMRFKYRSLYDTLKSSIEYKFLTNPDYLYTLHYFKSKKKIDSHKGDINSVILPNIFLYFDAISKTNENSYLNIRYKLFKHYSRTSRLSEELLTKMRLQDDFRQLIHNQDRILTNLGIRYIQQEIYVIDIRDAKQRGYVFREKALENLIVAYINHYGEHLQYIFEMFPEIKSFVDTQITYLRDAEYFDF